MQITIGPHTFEISAPYGAGREVGEAERKALDQLRAENIRNNMAKQLARQANAKGVLSPEDLEAFRHQLAEYDRVYQFGQRGLMPQVRQEGLQEAIRKVAQERAREAANSTGILEKVDQFYEKFLQDPSVRAEAQRRWEISQAVAADALRELLS